MERVIPHAIKTMIAGRVHFLLRVTRAHCAGQFGAIITGITGITLRTR
jgi:hypothetical protein